MDPQIKQRPTKQQPSRPIEIREIQTNSIMVGQPDLHSHDTKVELIKENGVVSHIQFICDCGQKTIVKCVYTPQDMP